MATIGASPARPTPANTGGFDYEYHTGDGEEPEGLTYWDLNDGRAPGIGGVLHALLLDNDRVSDDAVFFKHYN